MILVTDLDQRVLMLNSDLIQYVQETPDTVIVLITGESFRVRESMAEVRNRVVEFRREIGAAVPEAAAAAIRRSKERGDDWNGAR